MMGSIHQASPDGAENKGLAELNYDMQHELKEVRDGIMGEGQGLSEEDESRINDAALDRNDVPGAAEAPPGKQPGLQKQQQQQAAGPIVQWERILPVRTLKVLLVENDDSTRQVVSALLRNCSYEVTATANGLQAWKILENLPNSIDLVLTEVVMPCLSGIGLLCKIMSHNTCKNIPVIMMSSNDSMGTVFKCLSKGAVDFLVKPIRKNELKNLWQHVWRRCHSSSGSVSESVIQTQKSTKSKSADDSENNTGSNDEDDNGSVGLNARDGSDNGSGTQSSWRKHVVEVESPEPMSPSDQLPNPHDSTCAQVIPKPEMFCNKWVAATTNGDCQEKKELSDDLMGKDLEIGVPRNPDARHESYPIEKVSNQLVGRKVDKQLKSDHKNKGAVGLESCNVDEPSTKAADLIGGIANNSDTHLGDSVAEVPNGFSRIFESKGKTNDGSMELPSLQLSLKRLRSTADVGNASQDDRNVLRRSNQSAFTRYRTSAASSQAPMGYVGSCSPIDNSSEAVKTDTVKQGSNGSSNNNDMGSTTENAFPNPAAYKEKAASPLAVNCIHPSSAFQPVQIRTSASQQVMQEKIDDGAADTVVGKSRGVQHQFRVQHHHHHYHHHHHHVHSMQQQQQPLPPPDHNDSPCKTIGASVNRNDSLHKNIGASAQHCGSSNVFSGPVEGNAANYSINRSNSGSNTGSNGQNGNTRAVNNGGTKMETANGITEKSAVGGGNGSGSGSGMDHSRSALREAALNKFRQKRKERNFGKKVRYQSRKRLAEQRPRVRGQFVRQTANEHTSRDVDS